MLPYNSSPETKLKFPILLGIDPGTTVHEAVINEINECTQKESCRAGMVFPIGGRAVITVRYKTGLTFKLA